MIRLIPALCVMIMLLSCGKPADGTSVKMDNDAVDFSKYAVTDGFSGTLVNLNFATNPGARKFRDEHFQGVIGQAPNFAGHYSVVTWGCGTMCESVAVIDAKTGRVYTAPFSAAVGVSFHKDSRLLVVNPKTNIDEAFGVDPKGPPEGVHTDFYLWEENRFKLISTTGDEKSADHTFEESGESDYRYMFAGCYGGVFRSSDGGEKWENCGLEKYGIDELLMLPNGLLFAAAQWELGEFEPAGPGGIFRSNDFGDSWTKLPLELDYEISVYDVEISTRGELLAGTNGGLFRSADYGETWDYVDLGGRYAPQAISICRSGKNILVAASDVVYRSVDDGETWRNAGDDLKSIRSVVLRGDRILAGTFDGIFSLDPDSGKWVSRAHQPIITLESKERGPLLAGSQGDGIARSVDDGRTWNWLKDGASELYVNAFMFEPGRVLAGTDQGLFVSRDLGNTWKKSGFTKNITSLSAGETSKADFEFLASIRTAGSGAKVEMSLEPSKWIKLTEHDGGWVIYQYCFAGTPTVTFGEVEGEQQIEVFYGQDGDAYRVLETKRSPEAVMFTVKTFYIESEETVITFRYVDDSHKFGSWEGLFDGSTRFVNSDYEHEMMKILEEEGDCGEP